MSVTVADRIRDALPTLPRAERRVGLAILRQYPVAGLGTIAGLGEVAGSSGPTVLRFVIRLGYDGFPAFQRDLLGELDDRRASPLLQFDRSDPDATDTIDRARTVFAASIDRSLGHLDRTVFAHVADRLARARRVFTAGGRFSDAPAISLAQHLDILRSGVRHLPAEDRVPYLLSAARSDLVVVFDVRRYQRTSVDFGREAVRHGAELVVVTDPWLSPLAMETPHVLTVGVEGPSPFDTLVPATALVETLVAAVTERLGDAPKARLAEYDRLWDQQQFRYSDIDADSGG